MSKLTIDESSRIAILKKLEEVGLIENSGYTGLPSNKLLAGFSNYWGDRLDVARQAVRAHDQGEKLVGHPTLSPPEESSLLAFDFGVELGKLLAKLEYPLSPEEVEEIIEWKRKIDLTRKGSDVYKEGEQEVRREAASYASVYLHLLDHEKKIRITELAGKVFEHLCKKYPATHPWHRHIPGGKKPEDAIKKWIKNSIPDYAKTGGRPSKKG